MSLYTLLLNTLSFIPNILADKHLFITGSESKFTAGKKKPQIFGWNCTTAEDGRKFDLFIQFFIPPKCMKVKKRIIKIANTHLWAKRNYECIRNGNEITFNLLRMKKLMKKKKK